MPTHRCYAFEYEKDALLPPRPSLVVIGFISASYHLLQTLTKAGNLIHSQAFAASCPYKSLQYADCALRPGTTPFLPSALSSLLREAQVVLSPGG
jgi:hypothetical protein